MTTEVSLSTQPHAPSSSDLIMQTPEHRLLAILPAMAFVSLANGVWAYVNPAFCAYTGLAEDALRGLGWSELLHADDRAGSLRSWQAALRSGVAFELEHRLRGADGRYRWFRVYYAPEHNEAGALTRWAGIAMPGEYEHQAATERALRQKAEQARDERERVVALVAHELRAPLTVLLGQVMLLKRRLEARDGSEPGDRRAVDALATQTLRLKELMSALLDTAQIDHGQMLVSTTTLDLGALVARVVQANQQAHTSHTLQLQASTSPSWVVGDALRIEQVLQNLLQNAVKYSPPGSTVSVSLAPLSDQARIVVSDEGIGIAASDQQALFQPFYRARSPRQRGITGLGLGLYLCKSIVELHGGSITLESTEGAGCTVTVLLPRLQTTASLPIASNGHAPHLDIPQAQPGSHTQPF